MWGIVEGGFPLQPWTSQELSCCAEIGQCSPCRGPGLHTQFFYLFPYFLKIKKLFRLVCVCQSAWGRREASREIGKGVEATTPGLRAAKSKLLPPEQSALASLPSALKSLRVVVAWRLHSPGLRPVDPADPASGDVQGEGWEPDLISVAQGELPSLLSAHPPLPASRSVRPVGPTAQTSHQSLKLYHRLLCIQSPPHNQAE